MRILILSALCLSLSTAVFAENVLTPEKEKFAVKVDLNSANERELAQLPGVGALNAQKIIAGRPYTTVEDLARVGVSALIIQKISPLVIVTGNSTPIPIPFNTNPINTEYKPNDRAWDKPENANAVSVDLNHATLAQLQALPGITPARAREIVVSRPLAAISDLSRAGLTRDEIETLASNVFVERQASTTDLITGIQYPH